MLGSGYVVDHCIAIFKKEQKEELYRIYVTDTLKMLTDIQRLRIDKVKVPRFYDLIHKGKEETRSADEIIDSIKDRLERLRDE